MRQYILITLLLLCKSISAQDRVFPELDFDNNKYELYVFNSFNEIPRRPDIKFTISDPDTIRQLCNTWQGAATNQMLLCGYDYNIYIVSDNKIQGKVKYNSECNQAVSSQGVIDMEDNPFGRTDRSQAFSEYTFEGRSREESRVFLNSVYGLEDVFVPLYYLYQWKDYDGYFMLTIEGDADKRENEHSFEAFDKKIHEHYPDDNFLIDLSYTSVEDYRNGVEYHVNIYCMEGFRDKFDMYEGKFGWKVFDSFDVHIFGKNDIIEKIEAGDIPEK